MQEPLYKPFHCFCQCAVEWVLLLELALRWDHLIPLTWFAAHVEQLHSRAQVKSWGLQLIHAEQNRTELQVGKRPAEA